MTMNRKYLIEISSVFACVGPLITTVVALVEEFDDKSVSTTAPSTVDETNENP